MEDEVFYKSKAGTPQGGVISPLLANVALDGLEYDMKQALKVDLFNYMKKKQKVACTRDAQKSISIIRYADDFVVIHEKLCIIEKAKKFVQQWLKQIGLTLSETKTRITHTLKSIKDGEVGFKFLGFWVRQYPTKNAGI
jgi:RNA-directed DNA polymerase